MSDVILITGNVYHTITLDPGVWIFDDRKKRLDEFFKSHPVEDEALAYQEKIGKLWDKELSEGFVPTKESEQLFVHKKDISGDWGIPFAPFLANAKPKDTSSSVICHLSSTEQITLSMQEALGSILCFALDGKPIRENGPIHLIYGDGSNQEQPIKGIINFEIM